MKKVWTANILVMEYEKISEKLLHLLNIDVYEMQRQHLMRLKDYLRNFNS